MIDYRAAVQIASPTSVSPAGKLQFSRQETRTRKFRSVVLYSPLNSNEQRRAHPLVLPFSPNRSGRVPRPFWPPLRQCWAVVAFCWTFHCR